MSPLDVDAGVDVDVLVIGAGPAGACAARAAVRAGARVRLLDAAAPPRAKPCAGLLAASALADLEDDLGPLPPAALATPALVPRVRLHLGPAESYALTPAWPAVRVARRAFDAHLARHAGVPVEVARVASLTEEPDVVHVALESGEAVAARLVIVAAGAGTPLAGAGRRGLAFAGRGVHTLGPGVAGLDARHLLLLGAVDDGLVVIDPDGPDAVSVTTITKRPRDWKVAHGRALAFAIRSLGLALRRERAAEFGWVARGGPAVGRGRVLAAGDAAGLGLALGCGLEAALVSGRAAGEAATAPDPAADYARRLAPWLARRARERGTLSLLRARAGGWCPATPLAAARMPLLRRVVMGERLRALVRGLDARLAPPTDFPL